MFTTAAINSTLNDSLIAKRDIRILIADDHTFTRKGLKAAIQPEPDMRIIGEAANGIEAIATARALMPDVILMDVLMPEMDGLEAAWRISMEMPSVRVLIISNLNEQRYVERAKAHGAAGFITKSLSIDELRTAIRIVAGGGEAF